MQLFNTLTKTKIMEPDKNILVKCLSVFPLQAAIFKGFITPIKIGSTLKPNIQALIAHIANTVNCSLNRDLCNAQV